MLNLQNILRTYWPYFLVLFLNGFYLLLIGNKAGSFSWDFPGQTHQAVSSLTDLQGSIYNFKYFLGFYPILYAPLVSTFRDLISAFGVDPYNALIILVAILQSMFFLFLYVIFRLLKVSKVYYLLLSLVLFSTSIGFQNLGVWEAGTVPALAGFTIFTIFIYIYLVKGFTRQSYVLLGYIFGLAILTHAVTASVIGLAYIVMWIVNIVRKDTSGSNKYLFFSFILGLCIGAVWWVAYLSMTSDIPRGSKLGYSDTAYILLVGIMIFMILKNVHARYIEGRVASTGILAVLLLLLGIFPILVDSMGIQFNRYVYYGLIAGVPIMFYQSAQKKNAPKTSLLLLIAMIVIIIVFTSKEVYRLRLYPTVINTATPTVNGRLLDVSDTSAGTQFPHYFNTKLVEQNENAVATGGLFVENAPNAIIALSLRMTINENAWFPLFSRGYKSALRSLVLDTFQDKIRLLGVNYLVVSSTSQESYPENNSFEAPEKIAEVFYDSSDDPYTNIYIVGLKERSELVEVLSYLPKYAPDNSFYEKWPDLTIENLYSNDSRVDTIHQAVENEVVYEGAIEHILVESDKLSFDVISEQPVPILVKFAYSENLRATANGIPTDILEVSPDLILVFTSGHVEIVPYVSFGLRTARVISVVFFFSATIYLIYTMLLVPLISKLKLERRRY